MEAPSFINDAAADADDVVYPCKGCGEILEEGKAFELAGNRWHIDCFRCNTCGTLLDSDANLLLLGDGSLICNNCTYSCSACGNKIEDLAILTGDQAFCASCFKCRNCKRKIENLRYARTSQGIFCMQCHETLMARRRKKSKAANRASSANSGHSPNANAPVVLDKSLPALPPHIISSGALPQDPALSTNSSDSLDSSHTVKSRKEGGKVSPVQFGSGAGESLTLPSSTYSVQSVYSPLGESIDADDGDEMFMTVSMDDTSPGPPPISPQRGTHSATESNKIQTGKEYFGTLQEGYGGLAAGSPRTGSAERSSAQIPPHIAYQDKKQRQSSVDLAESIRKRNLSGGSAATSTVTSPVPDGATTPYSDRAVSGELDDAVTRSAFRLTEPPRIRRSAGSRSISKNLTPVDAPGGSSQNEARDDQSSDSSPNEPIPAPGVPRRRNSSRLLPALDSDRGDSQSLMGDMQRKPSVRQLMARKEVSADASKLSQNFLPGQPQVLSNNLQSTLAASFLADGPPARSAARPNSAHRPINPLTRLEGMSTVSPALDATASPAQPGSRHKPQESTSSIQSENFQSERYPSALPAPSPMPDFSMEEEMGRIMRGEENEGPSSGLFHRVSKAVRHNRSHSDNNKPTVSPRWGSGRTIRNGSAELGSPLVSATGVGDSKEEVIQLRNRLNVVHQRMSEVESERDLLHEKINGTIDLRQVNSELREKRSTVAFLDTQREMVIRELEIMTEHLGRAKDSSEPLDMADMKSEALKDFTASLRKLKDTLGVQIEELVHKKNDLNVDLGNLNQHRDRVLGELERTTARHTQLYELNNQLVHNIQELYTTGGKANGAAAMPMPMPVPLHAPPVSSGLGIYNNGTRIDQSLDHRMSVEARSSADHSMSQISGLSGDTEVASEGGSGLSGPQVVSIRKGVGQPKKFSWKKSGAVAKNVTKGFKGAFGLNENQQTLREEFAESAPYGSLPHGEAPLAGATASPPPSRLGTDQGRHALAMRQAAASKGFARTTTPGGNKETPPPVVAARADTGKPEETQQTTAHLLTRHAAVFGSELTARCDFERRVIPAIVTRCIEEVERRGISVEGIYRKSGSATQVKAIQASFERDYTAGHEVGNPELDIHAVTSALKQYLRRLPTPLITWECYDPLLDAASSAPGDEVDADERVRRVRHCVDALPPRHRDTLEFLVAHLVRVMGMEQQNLMTPLNLAVVFAPTIMRPAQVEREMSDMQAQRVAVQLMLEQASAIFA